METAKITQMQPDPTYEDGFTRRGGDEPTPGPLADPLTVRTRRRKVVVIATVVALLAIGALGAAGYLRSRQDTPVKQLARGKAYAADGKHVEAIIELKRSLQESPIQPDVRFLLANEFWAYGDAKSAAIEYRKAMETGLPAETGLVPLAQATLAQGDFAGVVEIVNGAVVDAPETNAELQTMLGTAYIGLERTDAGFGAFKAAKELVPHFTGALIAESRYLFSKGKYTEAETVLASVPADDKRQGDLMLLKGDIAQALKRPQEAVEAYEAALRIKPNDQETGIHLAQMYVNLGRLDEAQSRIDRVTKRNPRNDRAQYVRGMTAFLRHDLATAKQAISLSLQYASSDGKAQLLAGSIDVQLGELVEAEQHLRDAVRLLPQAVEPRKILANLYLQRQQPVQAVEVLRPALLAVPLDPEVVTLAVKIALLRGDAVNASNLFEQAAGRESTDVNTNLVGASLLFTVGKPDAALARLNAAARAHPENAELDAALVLAQLQLRRNDAALAAWRSYERKKPDDPRAYKLLAQIALARGDAVAARKALDKALTLDPVYYPAVADLVLLDLQSRQPDQARARLRHLIEADPKSVDAPLSLAKVEEANGGQPALVAGLLETARRRDPRSIQAIAETMAFHRRQNDPAAELAVAEQGLAIDPNNQALLSTASDLLQSAGQKERALAMLMKLTALNNEDPDYAVRLGLAQIEGGQSEAALRSFRTAYQRAPQRADLQVASIEAFIAAGQTEDATRALFEVSQLAPRSPVIGELTADIKLAAKQFPEALTAYRYALTVAPSTRLAIKTYQALLQAKQRGQAAALLVDWQARHPADPAIWLFDAQVALDAKDYVRAARSYRKVLDITPEDPTILNNLAWTLDQSNDPKALAFAEKANRLAPNNAEVTDTFGWILVQNGQVGRGLDLIEQATSLAPHKLDIRLRLAKAQIRGDRKDAARTTLQSLIAESPDSVEGKESRTLLSAL